MRPTSRMAVVAVTFASLAVACGGGGDTASDATVVEGEVTSPAPQAGDDPAAPTTPAGGSDEPTDAAPEQDDGQAAPEGGSCTVTTTGDRQDSWTFPQSITSFSSDYWLSEEDLRRTIEFLGEDITGGSYEDFVARGEAIITLLSISCSDPDNLIQGTVVTHGNATRVGDLPMGPGSYPISGGLFSADTIPAGAMIADFSVDEDETYATVEGSGSLDITRWDLNAIEGSYTFDAQQVFVDDDPKQISVSVQFAFTCPGQGIFTGC